MVMNKMENPKAVKKSLRNQNLFKLLLLLIFLVVLNVISSFVFTRFDLTSEKRFTLSPATKELVKNLNDVVYIRVYLDGDFPPAFKRLQNATREMLDELRAYSNGNIEYEFINPSASANSEDRNKIYQQLASKGIQPTNLQSKNNEGSSQQVIFPGAMVTFMGDEIPLMLLQDQIGTSPEQMLNNSIQSLEYGFGNAIRKLSLRVPQIIAFINGNGNAKPENLADIKRELKLFYLVEDVTIGGKLGSLAGYKAIVIAAPDSAFDEKDKFIIDQYVMSGGKVLWLVDGTTATMDSLQNNAEMVAASNDLNLDDMLFRYGARLNHDLVLDLQAAPIPIVTGYVGNRPQQNLMPWFYFPVVVSNSKHPVVNNLNAVKFEFVSSIDMVGSPKITKTPLLTTSEYSRVFLAPARVNLELIRTEPDVKQYNNPQKIVALLLEGQFDSNFKNRIPATIASDSLIKYRDASDSTRMIVVSDGDVIKNRIRKGQGIIPLGEDRYTGQVYGNKSFIMNCIDYLCDDSGLMEVRSKELKLRLLDKTKLEDERIKWQVVNTAGPVLMILVFGIFKFIRRRAKFAK
jgi:ABC-2 type transport system permease protein